MQDEVIECKALVNSLKLNPFKPGSWESSGL
jgi:hypothetical protein